MERGGAGKRAYLMSGQGTTNRLHREAFYGALVTYRRKIDKVANDQAAQVAQTQLAGNLICRLQVGIKRLFFDIDAARRAGGC